MSTACIVKRLAAEIIHTTMLFSKVIVCTQLRFQTHILGTTETVAVSQKIVQLIH